MRHNEDLLERLTKIAHPGSRPGLEAIGSLLALLGNPQDRLKFVHCAGTNGKGSVMAFLEEILIQAGYHVGRFISPSLFCFEEMFRYDKTMIPADEASELIGVLSKACGTLSRQGKTVPTVFELECALAFLWFEKKSCDLVLLEAGMGGRDDATNIVSTTVLAVLTSISEDHKAYLGDTPEKIAAVKAGIIKPGIPVVLDGTTKYREQVLRAVETQCRKEGAFLRTVDPGNISIISTAAGAQSFRYRGKGPYSIRLSGPFQIGNAAVALEAAKALKSLGYPISTEAVSTGLTKTVWEGRFEQISEYPAVIIDGAHNPDAAAKLAEAVEEYFAGRDIYLIFGVFSDKEYDKIIKLIAPLAVRVFTVAAMDNPRALPSDKTAEAVRKVSSRVTDAGTVRHAMAMALDAACGDDVILVCGSLAFLHEVKEFFSERENYDRSKTSPGFGRGDR